ncbi:uncharacterized protein [Parasteatoda tepidariorum]|uniref:uncharacterized protein n=1 Tax=Parasteatoda tepidariorum TaxID=114398 RepID=UPI001C72637C|nr:uncharacterized protein LOC122272156 [Parasteatoda tepidariorum]
MSTEYNKSILLEYSTDPEVFQDMDKFELNEAKKFALSVKLQFPKFSKGFSAADFSSFIQNHVGGDENVVAMGRLSFPNEWQMQVKCKDIREKLIRLGRTKINSRTCWISPLSQSEVRGYVHWIPNAIAEESIRGILEPYGEVMFMEVMQLDLWTKVDCDSRYFALNLKPGQTMDDIPHFFKIGSHHGLITIRGRAPSCFHCRTIGHRKSECQKYREKLNSYCNRKPGSGAKRTKPRGRRYRPMPNSENPSASVASKKKRKKSKAAKAQPAVTKEAKVENSAVKEEVKTEESSTDMVKVAQDLVAKLERLKDHGDLQELSTLQSQLTNLHSKLNNQIVEIEKKLQNTVLTDKGEVNTPQGNGEQPTEEKKKKRKKKKKKNVSEAANETVPPNN